MPSNDFLNVMAMKALTYLLSVHKKKLQTRSIWFSEKVPRTLRRLSLAVTNLIYYIYS